MLKQAACPETVSRSVTASRGTLEAAPVRVEAMARPAVAPKSLPRIPIPFAGWLLEFRRRVVPLLVFFAVLAFVCYLWLHRLAPPSLNVLPQ